MEMDQMRRSLAIATIALAVAAPLGAQAAFKAEFLSAYAATESKFTQLAEATPWDKYSFKPSKDVRSTCEVFMHIAVDNYLLGGAVGLTMPAEMKAPNAEKCLADKAKVIATMKASFAAFNTALKAMKDADLEGKYTLFGTSQTKRAWLLGTATHAGEHLGQLIAYSRMNGIVPPWSK
jgi:hypothetical protein